MQAIDKTLHKRRMRAEARFAWYGRAALGLALLMLAILLGTIFLRGASNFTQMQAQLDVKIDTVVLETTVPPFSEASISAYMQLVQQAWLAKFPQVPEEEQRDLLALSSGASGVMLRDYLRLNPVNADETIPVWLPFSSVAERAVKGGIRKAVEAGDITAQQGEWLKSLQQDERVKRVFNTRFFTQGDSRQPENAGFWGAMVGSLLTVTICLLMAFPLGVATAVYLQEFAPKSKWVDAVEVNINNLAAVPSIVFGLLGLAVYISFFNLPRSAPLVGGMTLALMILPVIIISTRAALGAIPDSIRDAARALGASPLQVVWHHTLPLSLPGIMTGTILGVARALGETAPLLMIGMVAFVADVPTGFTSPATVMPVQIYLWASSPESGFVEKTSAGIIVLLAVLLALNALAIYIRRRFEVKW